MNLKQVEAFILKKLENELSPKLTYHGVHHTVDVYNATLMLAEREKVTGKDLDLLKAATFLHDTGFLFTYRDHEKAGCEYAQKILPSLGFDENDLETICSMIMATRLPQSPNNKAEEILCDADLDYLGRDDFWPIANSLYQEFLAFGIIQNAVEWNRLQVSFLEKHHYFTPTAKKLREKMKQKHLKEVKEQLAILESQD
ncbi:MAG: HD domain-containing protein [Bacteroidia bacterium]